jgi:hypothetical protein
MAHDNTNRGAVWKNRKKEQDTHPDFTGSLNVDGVEYWVSAWKRKEGASEKAPALSFSIKPKEDNSTGRGNPVMAGRREDSMDDEIPF